MSYDFFKLLVLILTILSSFVYSTQAQTAPEIKLSAPISTAKDITGAWELNREKSDDATAKIALMLVTKPEQAEKLNVGRDETPAVSISLYHPESLVLAAGNDGEMTINQGYTDVVETRTVIADEAARFYEIKPGVLFSVTAAKQKDSLRVETVSPRGNKMIETFALADGGKLNVTMRIENRRGEEIITMRRVYDRTILDIFSADDDETQ